MSSTACDDQFTDATPDVTPTYKLASSPIIGGSYEIIKPNNGIGASAQNSILFGDHCECDHSDCVIMGSGLHSTGSHQLVIGVQNDHVRLTLSADEMASVQRGMRAAIARL